MSPLGRNSVWCYDFVFDSCANGQQLKCLTVVDEYTRECLAIDVAGSIHVRDILINGRDQVPPATPEWTSPQHAHVRGPGYYQ